MFLVWIMLKCFMVSRKQVCFYNNTHFPKSLKLRIHSGLFHWLVRTIMICSVPMLWPSPITEPSLYAVQKRWGHFRFRPQIGDYITSFIREQFVFFFPCWILCLFEEGEVRARQARVSYPLLLSFERRSDGVARSARSSSATYWVWSQDGLCKTLSQWRTAAEK